MAFCKIHTKNRLFFSATTCMMAFCKVQTKTDQIPFHLHYLTRMVAFCKVQTKTEWKEFNLFLVWILQKAISRGLFNPHVAFCKIQPKTN